MPCLVFEKSDPQGCAAPLCEELVFNRDSLQQALMNVNKRELLSTFFTVVQSEDFVCCVVPTELGVCTLCGMVLCDTGGLGVNKVQFTGGHICGYGAFYELRTFIMCLPV